MMEVYIANFVDFVCISFPKEALNQCSKKFVFENIEKS